MTIASTSLSFLDWMLYSAGASTILSMDSSFFTSTPKMYASSHSDQNFLYTSLMCLKSAFLWGSYDEGTLLIAFARLALATSDTWEVAAAGCLPDDDSMGLFLVGRPPTELDCCLGLALPDVGLAPTVSTDPWLGFGGLFSLETERGLANALWASNFPLMTEKSYRRELTFVQSRFPTVGDLSRSLYSPLSIFASTCLISPLYSMGSRLSKKCDSVKGICFDGRMRVKWYTS